MSKPQELSVHTQRLIQKYFIISEWTCNWFKSNVDTPQGLATWNMYSNAKYPNKMPYDYANSCYAVYLKFKFGDRYNHCRAGHTTNGLVQRDRSYLHSYYPRYTRVREAELLTVEHTDRCVLFHPSEKLPNAKEIIHLLEEHLIEDLKPSYNPQRPRKLINSNIIETTYGIKRCEVNA